MKEKKDSDETTENTRVDSISELFYRLEDGSIANAPEEEVQLVNAYLSENEGEKLEELVLLSTVLNVKQNETIRVIHLYRTNSSEKELLVNGPKEVYDEYVDGVLSTDSSPSNEYPWTVIYDGRSIQGPGTDAGFDITQYTFDRKGEHTIVWKSGGLESNTLKIVVE